MSEPLFHLAEPKIGSRQPTSTPPASLDAEGFIHCSTGEQLSRTARELYTDCNHLILLTIDPGPISDHIIYEDLYDAGEQFPHVYGAIPTSAVQTTGPYLNHLEEGLWLENTRSDRD